MSISLSIEDGFTLSFIDFEPRLGEAITVTFDDWRNLSVDGLGTVSSSSCVLVGPDASEYCLELHFDDGASQLKVWVKGQFKIETSTARVF
ncbi:hypothetical protein ENSA7_59320 [Enhygromyxa salina]|uniref:Uncharacterized protein n=2 Tax=Enhygromyxa salina TaxID=215803 RepID=A0A2S9Y5R7_9BACT|nr:hypothetical protein ENSA7_59320 [Enhygromyxa salina]